MFEIRKKEKPEGPYTHEIYFQGKLFAKEAYPSVNKKGAYCYDDDDDKRIKELFAIPCNVLPERLWIRKYIDNAYEQFYFEGVERKGKLIEVRFFMNITDREDETPEEEMFGFFFWLILLAKKSTNFSYSLYDTCFELIYTGKAAGTIGDVYKEAKSALKQICKTATKKTKLTEHDFLNSN